MISKNYIMKLLSEYANSPSGKKEIKKKTGIDGIGVDKPLSHNNMRAIGNRLKEILVRRISLSIPSISGENIVVSSPIKNGNKYTASVTLVGVFRESLLPGLFPEGVQDIVLHFTTGWDASGVVQGSWHGNDSVVSRRYKTGETFILDAIKEFNQKNKGIATVTPAGEYKDYLDI